jgi:acyl-coenzyme A thioesterase PaaI-like protein
VDGPVISASERARLMGDDDPPSTSRAVLHELTEQVRAVSSQLVLIDAEGCEPEQLRALESRLVRLREDLGSLPNLGAGASPAAASGPGARLNERSPVSGRVNPVAAPLIFRHEGERTLATATYAVQHEGPPGHVHGGVVAAAFDELLGVAQMAAGAAGFTGSLSVRFHRPTPLHVPITYEARVEGRDGRKLTVTATSTDGRHELAEARGVFVVQHELTPSGS